jgi:hypothetical protein
MIKWPHGNGRKYITGKNYKLQEPKTKRRKRKRTGSHNSLQGNVPKDQRTLKGFLIVLLSGPSL